MAHKKIVLKYDAGFVYAYDVETKKQVAYPMNVVARLELSDAV